MLCIELSSKQRNYHSSIEFSETITNPSKYSAYEQIL